MKLLINQVLREETFINLTNISEQVYWVYMSYRRWGDKTSYLKNVKCSGEPKKHGCFNTIMNGTAFFLPCHSDSIFSDLNLQFGQDKIYLFSLVTRSCHPTDNMSVYKCFDLCVCVCVCVCKYDLKDWFVEVLVLKPVLNGKKGVDVGGRDGGG